MHACETVTLQLQRIQRSTSPAALTIASMALRWPRHLKQKVPWKALRDLFRRLDMRPVEASHQLFALFPVRPT